MANPNTHSNAPTEQGDGQSYQQYPATQYANAGQVQTAQNPYDCVDHPESVQR